MAIYKTYQLTNCEQANHTLNNILDIINEGIWDWSAKTGCVIRSPGWYRMLDYEVGIFLKDVFIWENIIHPDDYPRVMKNFELYTTGKIDRYSIEYRCQKADGSYLWIKDRARVVERDVQGNISRMIGAHENIHERKTAQNELIKQNELLIEGNISLEKLLQQKNIELERKNIELKKKINEVEYLSVIDDLTTIGNRRYFETQLKDAISRSKRYQHCLSLIIFDIDLFKKINDKYGHEKGDLILTKLAVTIKGKLRENDCFARWGGEEFALILPETGIKPAAMIAEKLRHVIQHLDFENNLFITCSFGVAEYSRNELINELFSRADKALYKAKQSGRNRVQISDKEEEVITKP
ncbi:MAG: diguanylate cyclase [Psychromonas sp.]